MPRTNSPPKYRRHRASGLAVVTLTDGAGTKKDYYLGKHGTAESKAEYARLIGDWLATAKSIPAAAPPAADLTINELLVRFWGHARTYYRTPEGTPSGELENFKYSLRPLREAFGRTAAAGFTPLNLKSVRQTMIDSGLARPVVNRRVARIKLLFRWAVGEGLVPPAVLQGLQAVAGLARGRTEAREPEPIVPVADEVVEKTLPVLPRHVWGLVQFMRLTGCRPGEACRLRMCEVDTSGPVWVYSPSQHKTRWRGRSRLIHIGPLGQKLLAEFPTASPEEFVFSPARQQAERSARMRALRRTSVQPSQRCRVRPNAKRRPGARYSPRSLSRAIALACDKVAVPHWHAHRLRHTVATQVRKQFGLEHAAATLGHTELGTTLIYAQKAADLAVRVALAIG